MVRFFLCVLSSIWMACAVQADQIRASDPQQLMDFLSSEGIIGRLGKDDYGDPNIRIKYYNTNFLIYFYGCAHSLNCKSIQLYSGYRTNGDWPADQANLWNAERRFAKAYVNEQGHARLEMDVFLGDDGLSESDFSENFAIWTRAVGDFEETIGW